MPWHFAPVVQTVRWYEPGDCYEAFDDIGTVGTLQHFGFDSAYIGALHGRMTRQMWREMRDALASMGLRELRAVRHGKSKLYTLERCAPINE